jgi:Zn-dependent protease with chaperone function
MTWTPIIDILADIGAATVYWLWLPFLVWSIFAPPAHFVLRHFRLDAHLQYRARQGLLIALPIGLLLGLINSWSLNLSLFSSGVRTPLDLSVPDSVIPPSPETTSSSKVSSGSWLHAVGLLTVTACAIGAYQLSRFLADVLALARFQNQSEFRLSPSVQNLTDRLADDLAVQRSVETWIASRNTIPQTVGLFRPTILVPETLTEDRDALRMTLTHELIHVRRYDCLAEWIERLVASLFAIHPGVGILRRSIAHFREQSCDAAVLRTEACGRSQYAALLYRLSVPLDSQNSFALRIGDPSSSLHV